MFEAVDLGRTTNLVDLDLSTAFDIIVNAILLNRLESSFGVTGSALSSVRLYLTDRTSFIRVFSASSSTAFCNIGVP